MPIDHLDNLDIREIVLGQPIPWDIVNARGRVVFKKGFIFNAPQSLDRIAALELYCNLRSSTHVQKDLSANCRKPLNENIPSRHISEDESNNPRVVKVLMSSQSNSEDIHENALLTFIEEMVLELKDWMEGVFGGKQLHQGKLIEIADNLQRVFLQDEDLCLASIYMLNIYPSVNTHPINMAFLCLLGAEIVGIRKIAKIQSLVCSALTANLSLYREYEKINHYPHKMTQELKLIIQAHPHKSARILRSLGVKDTL